MCVTTHDSPTTTLEKEGQVQSPNCSNNHYTLETEYIAWLLYEV